MHGLEMGRSAGGPDARDAAVNSLSIQKALYVLRHRAHITGVGGDQACVAVTIEEEYRIGVHHCIWWARIHAVCDAVAPRRIGQLVGGAA